MDLKSQSRSAHAEGRGLEGAFKICAVALWEMFCLIMLCLVIFSTLLVFVYVSWFQIMYFNWFVSACVCFLWLYLFLLFYSPDLFHCDLIFFFLPFFLFVFVF